MKNNPIFRIAFLAAQSYGVTVLGLFIGILSARGLSVSDRGTLAIILLITQLCSRIGSIGFEQVIHREGIKEHPQNFYLAGMIGALLSLPVAMASAWVSNLPITLTLIVVITAGFISILRVNLAWLIYLDKLKTLFLFNVSQSVLQFLLYAAIFNTGSLSAFYLVWIGNVVIFSIVSVIILHNLVGTSRLKIPEVADLLNVWRKGFRYVGVAVPEMALSFCLELPVIRYLMGGTTTGLYAVSNTLSGIYYQLFVAASSVIAKNALSGLFRLKMYAALFVLLILGVLVSRPLIVTLFGDRYSGAAEIFAIIAPATFLLGVSRIEYIVMKNPPKSQTQVKLSILLIIALVMGITVGRDYIFYYIALAYSAYALLSIAVNMMEARANVKL